MIFDRTEDDVKNALRIREEKVKNYKELTQEDVETLEKGFITINTITRIENKQKDLKNVFNDKGYYSTPIVSKSWEREDYFLKSDLERIIKNNQILKDAYYVFSTTPTNARARAYFGDLNKIEKMLYDLEMMADDMADKFKLCGTFNCGG
jgi:hypothetical protein